MAITDPVFARSDSASDKIAAPKVSHGRSGASTWYLVTGAAVLLIVLYTMTTGLMRSVPEPLAADAAVLQPEGLVVPKD